MVTLFVKGAGAVDEVTNDTIRHDTTGRSLRYKFTARIFTRHTLVCCFFVVCPVIVTCSYLGDGGTNRRENLHDGTYRSRTGLLCDILRLDVEYC